MMIAAGAVATLCARRPPVRSMFLFGVASLTRSRRHVLVLARYVAMAIAAAILSVIGALLRGTFQVAQPQPYLLAIPLVFIFFAVFGLRGAIAVPTDVDAAWPFRLSTPTVDDVMRASRLIVLTARLWPLDFALRVAAFDLAAGLLVIEVSLLGWSAIPFATPHEPPTETIKSRWMWYLLFLLLFAKAGAALEFRAVQSTILTLSWLAAGFVAIAALRAWRRRKDGRVSPAFDAAPAQIESLNLSGALN